MSTSYVVIAVVLAATATGVVVQRLSGMGLSLVLAPALALALGPLDGVRLVLLLGLPVQLHCAIEARREIRWRTLVLLGAPAACLSPLFALLARHSPQRPLLLVAGCCCLVAVAVMASGATLPALRGPYGAVGAGVLSAAMNAASGIAGPPAAMYSVNAGWGAEQTRGTLSALFLVLGIAASSGVGLPSVPAPVWFAAGVGMVAGFVVGGQVRRSVPESLVRHAVLALAGLGGILMLGRAL